MSVTVTIENNRDYCDLFCTDKIETENYFDDAGKVIHTARYYPFTLNMSNGNFAEVWSLLFPSDFDFVGQTTGEKLKDTLLNFSLESFCKLLMKETRTSDNRVYCGRTFDQCEFYWITLREIAFEAASRKALIQWC